MRGWGGRRKGDQLEQLQCGGLISRINYQTMWTNRANDWRRVEGSWLKICDCRRSRQTSRRQTAVIIRYRQKYERKRKPSFIRRHGSPRTTSRAYWEYRFDVEYNVNIVARNVKKKRGKKRGRRFVRRFIVNQIPRVRGILWRHIWSRLCTIKSRPCENPLVNGLGRGMLLV